jgi:ribosomal protein S18 acetylase RimI-like enzyme
MKTQINPLFAAGEYRAFELQGEDLADLQYFFEANPEYFLAVEGRPAKPSEAEEEFHDAPPEGWSYTKSWYMGFVDETSDLIGMASLVSDLLAKGVWHIGLFMVATARFGSGDANALYQGLEDWVILNGAQWFRLGVVEGNTRAERFWEKVGFVETRKRYGIEMGNLINTVRYMMKPLAGGTLPEYLALVTRDQPDV